MVCLMCKTTQGFCFCFPKEERTHIRKEGQMSHGEAKQHTGHAEAEGERTADTATKEASGDPGLCRQGATWAG